MADSIEKTSENMAFSSEYSESGFWSKVTNFAKMAGREAIEKALLLYFALQDENVPGKAKAIIVGALGYFISPIDVIPDVIPAVGFTDDIGVLAAAIATIAIYVTDETKKKAEEKVSEWFD